MKYLRMKILFKYCYIALFVIISGFKGVQAQDVQQIDLQKAVDLALANNLQIKQAEFQEAISDVNLTQSRFELLPNLNGSVSANKRYGLFFDQTTGRLINDNTESLNGNLSSNVSIFNGFQLQNQIAQNKLILLADKSSVEKAKNDLILSVITTYLQVLNNKDLILASNQQLDLSNQQLNVAQRNFDVGNNTQADLSQAKAQVATNELNLTSAENAYEIALLNLRQLMEIDSQQEIAVVTPDVSAFKDVKTDYNSYDVYTKSLENYPDISIAKYNTLAAEKAVAIARGGYYPSLGFGAGINTGYSSVNPLGYRDQFKNNFGQSLGLSLSIPLFNNLRTRSSVNIAKFRYENAKVSEQLQKNNLNKIISQAVLDLRSAEKKYNATSVAFESSKEAFNVINKRYEVGLVNSIELNTSQTNYNKAEFDFIQAKYDLIFRSKVIDFYLGNPLTL
jgi:outer membrane protein